MTKLDKYTTVFMLFMVFYLFASIAVKPAQRTFMEEYYHEEFGFYNVPESNKHLQARMVKLNAVLWEQIK